MLHWGPALVNVSVRRLDASQLAEVGLRNPALRRCVVSLALEYRADPSTGCDGGPPVPRRHGLCLNPETYNCVIDRFGAYGCPSNADTAHTLLRNKNATTDKRGVLKLDVPLRGTHRTPLLAWQRRYPHTDGWIEPWTKTGMLRAGLRLTGNYRGSCFRGSYEAPAKTAGRCLPLDGTGIYDPCFPRRARWGHRGTVVACGSWPGGTTFGRFVITKLR